MSTAPGAELHGNGTVKQTVFAYASLRIRRNFGTAENFMATMRSGYRAVYPRPGWPFWRPGSRAA